MTKSTERKIIFALMAVLLAAICTSAVVTIVRFLKEPASASIVAPSSIGRGISRRNYGCSDYGLMTA